MVKILRVFSLCILAAAAILYPAAVYSQSHIKDVRFERVLMDSRFDGKGDSLVNSIISHYKPMMDKIMEVIGETNHEMRSARPESELSNLAAEALFSQAQKVSKSQVDFALTNFGGIRAALPKGAVRRYDILSIFPFENALVIIDLKGEDVMALFESFARNRVEVLSDNIRLEISGGKINSLLINGAEVDRERVYRVATIDFLLEGGDNVYALRSATNKEYTGVLLRDAVLSYISDITAKGHKIGSPITGRVIIK